ncbi:coatamer beta region [Teladorsagia circumcincta]|uniref:Coatamer beta region n=1 Tax=Teladorsagia circumcincta TaxID=45464 RepID=A0A2G9TCS5_TELCI|nr:coatamer beta region [Teladorsagia circumcincta]
MAALWILGTYCESDAAVLTVLRLIKSSLGELPIVESEMRLVEGEEPAQEEAPEKKVLKSAPDEVVVGQFLLDGDFFLGASLATVLNKLAEQFTKNNEANSQRSNRFRGECMFILASIINLGKSGIAKQNITEDDLDRMGTTIKLLAQGCSELEDVFVEKCKDSLELMLSSRQQDKADEISTKKKKNIVEVDKTIMFTQLSARADASIGENLFDLSLSQALVLDVLIVNQTADTLQNVSLELSTATVKVASTENGVIFSTISYDVRGSTSDRNCVYLQDIKIDIMDYIVPGNVTDAEFRQMWFDFEWENKVTVNTPITDLREFLHYLSTVTNMKVLTGDAAIEGDCGFLAANLCAHSIFGEDALANVSIEKASPLDEGSPIVGHIRIRAKSQGMALTLGDKVIF